jgi:hypothetical protein
MVIMAAGALPFVIVVAIGAMLVLVAAAVRAIVMARLVPSLGSAISAGFPSWRIVSASSVMASSTLAIIVAYDDPSLWDFECIILWGRHVGLMARGNIVLVVCIGKVVLVGWRWISLWAFAIRFVIGGYWDGVRPVASFSSLDF